MAGRLSGFIGGHAGVSAEFHATQTLDVVFHLFGRVVRFAGDLAGRLEFDQPFVTDDRLVSHTAAHVVNRSAARDRLFGLPFVSQDGA